MKHQRIVFVTVFVSMFAVGIAGVCLFAFRSSDPAPDPQLSPEQVVQIQLDALKHNDPDTDAGIAITFRFASPANRQHMGPLERFALVLKSPRYRPMLYHKSAEFSPVWIQGGRAGQIVRLISADGQAVFYAFVLSKQRRRPYADCWMTDGVFRIPKQRLPPSYPDAPAYRGVPHDDMPI